MLGRKLPFVFFCQKMEKSEKIIVWKLYLKNDILKGCYYYKVLAPVFGADLAEDT